MIRPSSGRVVDGRRDARIRFTFDTDRSPELRGRRFDEPSFVDDLLGRLEHLHLFPHPGDGGQGGAIARSHARTLVQRSYGLSGADGILENAREEPPTTGTTTRSSSICLFLDPDGATRRNRERTAIPHARTPPDGRSFPPPFVRQPAAFARARGETESDGDDGSSTERPATLAGLVRDAQRHARTATDPRVLPLPHPPRVPGHDTHGGPRSAGTPIRDDSAVTYETPESLD